jgi:hypothetical protein
VKGAVDSQTDRGPGSDVVWLSAADLSAGPVEELPGPSDLSRMGDLRRRRLGWAAIGLAVAMLVAVTVIRVTAGGRSERPAAVAPPPAVLPSPSDASPSAELALPQNRLLAMTATSNGLYVLSANPAQLTLRDPHGAAHVVRSPRSGFALVEDPGKRLVWVLGRRQNLGSATAYDSRTLAWRGRVLIPSEVNAAAAFGGRLWLASDAGVYVVSGLTGQPALVPGSYRYTYDITADPSRDRVLAVTTGLPGQTYGIDVTNLYVGRDDLVTTGQSSLAVVDGMAWVGGYGAGRHITLINGPDRQPPLPVERKVNSGVAVWPGRHVLWVTFSGGVSCLDPRTGAELASWTEITGPVTSANGVVYAAGPTGFLAATSVVTKRLPPRCPG